MHWNAELRRLYVSWNGYCTECGADIRVEEYAGVGYKADGKPYYVCNACSIELRCTASIGGRRITYVTPSDDTVVWRYLSLDKFLHLVLQAKVPLIRLNALGDPFEGAMSLTISREQWGMSSKAIAKVFLGLPTDKGDRLQGAELDAAAERRVAAERRHDKKYARTHYVSCWHESDTESDAMWKLYGATVALKTTVGRFTRAVNSPWNLRAGHVRYIEFGSEYEAGEFRAFCKRREFAHEREVRFLLRDLVSRDVGPCRYLKADLNILLEQVVLSPLADNWQRELIAQILPQQIELVQSNLASTPFHG